MHEILERIAVQVTYLQFTSALLYGPHNHTSTIRTRRIFHFLSLDVPN